MIDPDVLAVFTPGSGIVAGLVDQDGEPISTRAWSVVVVPGSTDRLRVVLANDGDHLTPHLVDTRMALTGGDIDTFVSRQVKGVVQSVEEATPEDRREMAIQSRTFMQKVQEVDGRPVELLERMITGRVKVVEMVVDETFDQTPGPGAGHEIGSSR
ncbi:MAG: hypothetical protein ACHQDC_04185 [Acidimicrobiales bacterium]